MKILVLLIPLFIIACNTSLKDDKPENNNNWIEYSTKDSIPKVLLNELSERTDGEFWIANPNEEYAATDVHDGNLPTRQLRFLGKKGNKWMLTYEHGGRGSHFHFIECEIVKGSIQSWRSGTVMMDINTLQEIEKVLQLKKIEFIDTHL